MKHIRTFTIGLSVIFLISCSALKGSSNAKRTPSSVETESLESSFHKHVFVQRALSDSYPFHSEVLIHLSLALNQLKTGKEILVNDDSKSEFRRALCALGLGAGGAPGWPQSTSPNCYLVQKDMGALKGLLRIAQSLSDSSASNFQFDGLSGGSSSGLGLLVFEKDPTLMKSFTGKGGAFVLPRLPKDASIRFDLIRAQLIEEIRSIVPELWALTWKEAKQNENFAKNINQWLKIYLKHFEKDKKPVLLQTQNSLEELLQPDFAISFYIREEFQKIFKEPKSFDAWTAAMNQEISKLLEKPLIEKNPASNTDESFSFFHRFKLQNQLFEGKLAAGLVEPRFFNAMMEIANLVRILRSDYKKTFYYITAGLFEFQRKADFIDLSFSQQKEFGLIHFEVLNSKIENLIKLLSEFHRETEFAYVNQVQSLIDSLLVGISEFQVLMKDRLGADSKATMQLSQFFIRTSELASAQALAEKRIAILHRNQQEFREEMSSRLQKLQTDLEGEFKETQERIAVMQKSISEEVSQQIEEVKVQGQKTAQETSEKLEGVKKSINEGVSEKIDKQTRKMDEALAQQSLAISQALASVREESFNLISRADQRIRENEIAFENSVYVQKLNEVIVETHKLNADLRIAQEEIYQRCFPVNQKLEKPEFDACFSEFLARINQPGFAVDNPERSFAFGEISIESLRPLPRNFGFWSFFQSRHLRGGGPTRTQLAAFKTLQNPRLFNSASKGLLQLTKTYPVWSMEKMDSVANTVTTGASRFEGFSKSLFGNGEYKNSPLSLVIEELASKEKVFSNEIEKIMTDENGLTLAEALRKMEKSDQKILGQSMGISTSFRAYAEAYHLAIAWLRLTLPNLSIFDPVLGVFLRDDNQVGMPEWVAAKNRMMQQAQTRSLAFKSADFMRDRLKEIFAEGFAAEMALADWIPLKSEALAAQIFVGEIRQTKERRQKALTKLQEVGRKFLADPKKIVSSASGV